MKRMIGIFANLHVRNRRKYANRRGSCTLFADGQIARRHDAQRLIHPFSGPMLVNPPAVAQRQTLRQAVAEARLTELERAALACFLQNGNQTLMGVLAKNDEHSIANALRRAKQKLRRAVVDLEAAA